MTTVDVSPLIGARLDESAALARTVDWAVQQAAAGRLPFAALVVRDGVVLGGGVNTVLDDHDPSGHGEVVAVRDATRRLGTADLAGAVVYSSCEPCAICRLVAAAAGVHEIVYAADKALVPAVVDADPATTARLIDAVTGVLPGIARQGHTGADVAAPFRGYAR
jgi:tRNA(Arg) A34 adenosine deaminase TadA